MALAAVIAVLLAKQIVVGADHRAVRRSTCSSASGLAANRRPCRNCGALSRIAEQQICVRRCSKQLARDGTLDASPRQSSNNGADWRSLDAGVNQFAAQESISVGRGIASGTAHI